ncbi:MAG: transposase [bacterium]
MISFNNVNPIGSLYEKSQCKDEKTNDKEPKLVEIISYCLNRNHYHLILEQVAEKGIEKFMHKLGLGYTNYFNEKNTRSGSLFQGAYKAIHVDSNEYLLHLSAYVNLNFKVHQFGNSVPKFWMSSWEEYCGKKSNQKEICSKDIVLGQFKSIEDYIKFAEDSLVDIQERKKRGEELGNLFLE